MTSGRRCGACSGALAEARLLQEQLRAEVVAEDRLGVVRIVGGVDAWTEPAGNRIWAAAVALGLGDLELLESAMVCRPTVAPYLPDFLSLREAPAACAALARLRMRLDLLFVDGQGMAHPRRFGFACHIGLLAATPTIGVAKSRLLGRYESPGPERGDWTPLVQDDDTISAVLRTRSHTRPVFVSVGHRISLRTALEYALHPRLPLAGADPPRRSSLAGLSPSAAVTALQGRPVRPVGAALAGLLGRRQGTERQ
jgi:deoxyribonuclease V